ncbi:MAG: phosphoribosylformylglycinamidine cyclo-ligase [Candidatus Fraserbacteria bacterium RBG_16_55_9]|uniref:Phosphoribosylformylglycinamidine cyclo-ligase n=1 Tax=Fraserbacteria sp. (strain RBG_16_55_9) TaxID=1817864 RepID=A0A1F5UNZ0_FRAXR|nr:MAG: phosphoribosylformylglycinamidine cyclo-ligase [Candidatus Fraserbacteria bacterium RBG_16_55_9]
MTTYKQAGVDIDLKDRCSEIFYQAAVQTFANRKGRFGEPQTAHGGFSGPIYISELKDAYILKNSDGVGTKVEVAERMAKHDTIAFDLVAMVCDDAAVMGAEPFALTDTLNVSTLNLSTIEQLAAGLVQAAARARVAVVGGEIAVLSDSVRNEYLWDADVVAVLERKKALDKQAIQPGDKIVGLREHGFRSNGFTLIRKILQQRFGDDWIDKPYDNKRGWGEVVLTSSLIYTPVIVDAVGAYGQMSRAKLKGAAHVTGGGIPGNLPRCLPEGLGAHINVEPLEPMLKLQEVGHVEDWEAYRVWNMGVGMLIVTNDEKIFEIAREHDMEAVIAGEVIDEPRIFIQNRGFYQKERELHYEI